MWFIGNNLEADNMMRERVKLYIYVTPELNETFCKWAEKMGVNKSQFGNMCIQAGMQHLIQAVSPLDAMRPDQMVALFKAAQEQGLKMDLSDIARAGSEMESGSGVGMDAGSG